MDLVSLFRSIPEGIWGVVVGSLLAFGGTAVATRRQLRHDAEQRTLDRKMQLRRDVFLEAAEGVAGTEYFMKLANADLSPAELALSTPKPGWLNKLFTVASLEAIEAFAVASAAFGAASLDLLRHRMSIDDVKNRIDAANQQIETMKAIQERIREAAAAATAESPNAEVVAKLATMQEHWDLTWREIERLGKDVSGLLDEKLRLQRQLLEQAVEYSIEYQKKLRAALIALRRELDFPLDRDRLEAVMDRIDSEMLPKFRQLLDAIAGDSPGSAV